MPDLQRFAIFTVGALVLFLGVLLWVIRNRNARPDCWSILGLSVLVVPVGMTFARYAHIEFQNLSWAVYYGVPAVTTFALPPFWLHMSRKEVSRYLPLALCMAPIIHVIFSLVVGWHDYMPFPIYIPSLAEVIRGVSR